jgi:hypothetical protein
MKVTHTYATLELSPQAYAEIRAKLSEAGYDHAFDSNGEIDMHGIAVTKGPECKHESFWPLADEPFKGARPADRSCIACLDCRRVVSIPGNYRRRSP